MNIFDKVNILDHEQFMNPFLEGRDICSSPRVFLVFLVFEYFLNCRKSNRQPDLVNRKPNRQQDLRKGVRNLGHEEFSGNSMRENPMISDAE